MLAVSDPALQLVPAVDLENHRAGHNADQKVVLTPQRHCLIPHLMIFQKGSSVCSSKREAVAAQAEEAGLRIARGFSRRE